MTIDSLNSKASDYLYKLVMEIPNRRVGSPGNRLATDYFSEVISEYGFKTECQDFDCIDWTYGEINLVIGDESFDALISPYSLGCKIYAPLVVASSVGELEEVNTKEKILLLCGDITKEQLMPKNFIFYNPEQHKHIYRLLEEKMPAAIIAATSRNPELAGGIYPFPLIEDGDFDIPSVYMTEEEGERLVEFANHRAYLAFEAERIPATGCNVIARKGFETGKKVVIWAHIDCKDNTPGALDNGTGVVVLLLLAELLAKFRGTLGLEIVALNGEDYYSAPGEVDYLKRYANKFPEIVLGVNLDAPGYIKGKTAYSLYETPDVVDSLVHRIFSTYEDISEGDQWYQGDHTIFVMNQRPALAITSDHFMELSTYVTHTPKDHPDLVDTGKLVDIAFALRELILDLEKSY